MKKLVFVLHKIKAPDVLGLRPLMTQMSVRRVGGLYGAWCEHCVEFVRSSARSRANVLGRVDRERAGLLGHALDRVGKAHHIFTCT